MMVKMASVKDLFNTHNYSEELILRTFDCLDSHNLWDQFLLNKDYKIVAPIQNPGKIIAIGLNYTAHASEGGREVPENPFYFAKVGSVVIGQDSEILIPSHTGRVDHELELAVVMGKKAKHVHSENVEEYIAGYTIFNDVTARDMQKQAKISQGPWFQSKNFDTFGPMGPCLVTRNDLPLPIMLDMELRVNGIGRQRSNTENMVFNIPQLISYITKYITLYPGDLISTGTPEGVGELLDGDIVEAEIEKIGILRNKVKMLQDD
jgi:2-keto-4-pentenoate hydratase/2-oxohepta-3-ene-1,7-dioic acid hydratase in catechol pathway